MPPRLVEGGTLVFDVDDVSVQLPGEIKYGALCRLYTRGINSVYGMCIYVYVYVYNYVHIACSSVRCWLVTITIHVV